LERNWRYIGDVLEMYWRYNVVKFWGKRKRIGARHENPLTIYGPVSVKSSVEV
jgi:hypothetical protein